MNVDPAPFIPPRAEAPPIPEAPWRVFGTGAFFRLWLAQVFSSLGDWVGLFAILAIAARVSHNSAAAVSLVMVARVVPGFFLATVGGVIVDRFDRRKVMVVCDCGRAGLLAVLPFTSSLLALVLVSFGIEILTLLWGPAKDASVPHLVSKEQLASANSLSLVASYGTFPFGAAIFSALAVVATWLGGFQTLSSLKVNKEVIALWVDAATYLTSAAIVIRLPIPRPAPSGPSRVDLTQSIREISEGIGFIRRDRLSRAVILGMGGGLIGAGAMIPLGVVFASEVLRSPAEFGVLMVALGTGAAIGVVTLLALQRRLPRETVFVSASAGVGACMIAASTFSVGGLVALMTVGLGACAGTAYVTGFTVLQEHVADELRGRTFATLYSVVRLCLLISLTVSPLFADLYEWLSGLVFPHRRLVLGGFVYSLAGVRFALWGGGVVTVLSALFAWRELVGMRSAETTGAEDRPSGAPAADRGPGPVRAEREERPAGEASA